MDFIWIDGTGHGMTFYKPDEVIAQNTKIESEQTTRDNLLYNSDFRAVENSGDFKGWQKNNEANTEFIKSDSGEGGKSALLAKNYINKDSAATNYPTIKQTTAALAQMFDNYDFPSSKVFTLSFVASVNNRMQNTDFVIVKETGRNLVLNSDFTFGFRNWFSESTQYTNEEVGQQFEEPSVASLDYNYKGWFGLTYSSSNVQQLLRYNLIQNGSYLLSFDAFTAFAGASIIAHVKYYNRRDELIRDYFQEIVIATASSGSRFTVNVPYPPNVLPSMVGSIIVSFERGDFIFDEAYTPMYGEEIEVSTDYRIYISNIKLEYNSTASEWTPAKEDILPDYSESETRNLLMNSRMALGLSSWRLEPDAINDDIFPIVATPEILALQPGQSLIQRLGSQLDLNTTYYLTAFIYTPSAGYYGSDEFTASYRVSDGETGETIVETDATAVSFSGFSTGYTKINFGSVQLSDYLTGEDNVGSVELVVSNPSINKNAYFYGFVLCQVAASSIDAWYPAPEDSGADTGMSSISELDNAVLDGRMLATHLVVGGTDYIDYYQLGSDPAKFVKTYTFDSEPSGFDLRFELGRGIDTVSDGVRYTSNISLTNIKMEAGDSATDWQISNYEYDPNVVRNYANTWRDWHIVPSSRPVVNPPVPKTNYIDIPGSNNGIDLTESLTGDVKYNSREGSFEFLVDTSKWGSWMEAYTTIMNYLHGRRMDLILDDEPNYYYSGRFTVNEWKSAKDGSSITIDYVVDAYKYELASSIDDWLWDPFNFETGIARDYSDITVNTYLSIDVGGSEMPVVPTFIVSNIKDSLIVNWKGTDYMLKIGVVHIPQIVISNNEENRLIFKGNGALSIAFKGGKL